MKTIEDNITPQKRAKWRGKNEERACSKLVKGVVVGRSKVVKVGDKYIQVNCQKPPDVVSPPYSFEVKNKIMPKSLVKAMTQAVNNCPQGLTPKLWWRDRDSGVRYLIELVPDFLDDHI